MSDDETFDLVGGVAYLSPLKASMDENNKEQLAELTSWMIKKADILSSKASAYACLFIDNGIGSFKRISKRLSRDPTFFLTLGVAKVHHIMH